MGLEPTIRGKNYCEIEESKIIIMKLGGCLAFMIGEQKEGEYFLLIIIE